jgi:uncharacterized caspase-like protein
MASARIASAVLQAVLILGGLVSSLARPALAQDAPLALGAQDAHRVALVISQVDYMGAPLANAEPDAALVATQLKQAGFEVESAVDLPEQGIGERVREFLGRVNRQGEDSVAFVYLVGRFAQINGENVLLPVGARLDRATDAALNGFSLRKLVAALQTVPARSRVIVIDAASAPPALSRDNGFVPGLALIDPPEGFLISFSQTPGRVLIDPPDKTGFYARAFLEAVQQPSRSFGDIFRTVRLRVYEETGGAQQPWEANRLADEGLAFFVPQEGEPLPAITPLVGTTMPADFRAIPPDEAYKTAIALDSIDGYQKFIEAYPDDPATPNLQYTLAGRREAEVWARAFSLDTPESYWTYVAMYPDGGNAFVARQRLAGLGAAAEPPIAFTPLAYPDLPPPLPQREIVASAASMPLELMPRAPSLRLPSVPATVTAAASAASAVTVSAGPKSPGRPLPALDLAAVRPSWAAKTRPLPAARGGARSDAHPLARDSVAGRSTATLSPAEGRIAKLETAPVVRPLANGPLRPIGRSPSASEAAAPAVPGSRPVAGNSTVADPAATSSPGGSGITRLQAAPQLRALSSGPVRTPANPPSASAPATPPVPAAVSVARSTARSGGSRSAGELTPPNAAADAARAARSRAPTFQPPAATAPPTRAMSTFSPPAQRASMRPPTPTSAPPALPQPSRPAMQRAPVAVPQQQFARPEPATRAPVVQRQSAQDGKCSRRGGRC